MLKSKCCGAKIEKCNYGNCPLGGVWCSYCHCHSFCKPIETPTPEGVIVEAPLITKDILSEKEIAELYPTPEDWEKEFDEEFYEACIEYIMPFKRASLMAHPDKMGEWFKSFLRKILSEQEEKHKKKIKKLEKELGEFIPITPTQGHKL